MVIGIFERIPRVESAVNNLIEAGCKERAVSIIAKERKVATLLLKTPGIYSGTSLRKLTKRLSSVQSKMCASALKNDAILLIINQKFLADGIIQEILKTNEAIMTLSL